MTTIVIVSGGLSEESATNRLGAAIETAAHEAADVEVRWVQLRPLARAIADHLVSGFPNPQLAAALNQLEHADAVVALTPTFQGSYAGLFKSFFDLVDTEVLTGVPVLLGATGGTARHSLMTETAMRPLFTYLHALVVPTAIFVATEDWGAASTDAGVAGSQLRQRIRAAVDQLLHLAAGAARTAGRATAETEFSELTDFADVLKSLAG